LKNILTARTHLNALCATSVCEELLRKASYTLFATHYLELTDLAIIYPHVRNVSLKVCEGC